MEIKNALKHLSLLACLLLAGSLMAQDYVKDVKISSDQAAIRLNQNAPDAYELQISGPGDYRWRTEIETVDAINLSNVRADGEVFPDGRYNLLVTPILKLTDEERATLRQLTDAQDLEGLAAFRAERNLPAEVSVFNVHFAVLDGQFITQDIEAPAKPTTQPFEWPSQAEDIGANSPSQYASLTQRHLYYGKSSKGSAADLATDETAMMEDAQVFTQDVVVQGSLCIGIDCPTAPNFGADTQRLQENNLRIHFDDTSNSGSFPSNDWRLQANDQTNGGRNYFAIEDATSGRLVFQVEAGAPANSLVVEADGDIGINTMDPVVELHIVDGDSPTVRLQQDGTAGFSSQTWDLAGNETNFFIRDVTHGSKLPFRIKPNAPDNSLYVWSNGNVGLGVPDAGPTQKLHIESGNVYVKSGRIGVNVVPTVPLDVNGNFKVTGTSFFTGDVTSVLTTGATFFNNAFSTVLRLDATNVRVGIGVAAPGHQLELSQDDAVKPNGGSWSAPSDRRLKQNIKPYTDGLAKIMQINPVTYNYNEKSGYDTSKEHVGIIAQEMQQVAPYMVSRLNAEENDYLKYDGTALNFMLVNAVQEQQALINTQAQEIAELKAQVSEMDALKAQMAALSQMVSELKAGSQETTTSGAVETTEDK